MTTKERLLNFVERLSEEDAERALKLLVHFDDSDTSTNLESNNGPSASPEELLLLAAALPPESPSHLLRLIGIAPGSGLPVDVATNHDKYLAEAYADLHDDE